MYKVDTSVLFCSFCVRRKVFRLIGKLLEPLEEITFIFSLISIRLLNKRFMLCCSTKLECEYRCLNIKACEATEKQEEREKKRDSQTFEMRKRKWVKVYESIRFYSLVVPRLNLAIVKSTETVSHCKRRGRKAIRSRNGAESSNTQQKWVVYLQAMSSLKKNIFFPFFGIHTSHFCYPDVVRFDNKSKAIDSRNINHIIYVGSREESRRLNKLLITSHVSKTVAFRRKMGQHQTCNLRRN